MGVKAENKEKIRKIKRIYTYSPPEKEVITKSVHRWNSKDISFQNRSNSRPGRREGGGVLGEEDTSAQSQKQEKGKGKEV